MVSLKDGTGCHSRDSEFRPGTVTDRHPGSHKVGVVVTEWGVPDRDGLPGPSECREGETT